MRSSASKGLKIEKKAPPMRKKDIEAPVGGAQEIAEEVTKVDESSGSVEKPVKRTSTPSKGVVRAVAPKLGLKVHAGLNMGTIFPLKKRRNVIGRRVDAAFPVQDERASRDHAAIEFKRGRFMLTDLSSTNGTFLNNKAVTASIYLKEGDHIRVGSSVFVVELMDEKNPDMVERWSSMTTIIPRAQVLEKAKATMNKPLIKEREEIPRWQHLTRSLTQGRAKHLHQARFLGMALGAFLIAAAIITSL